MERNKTLKVNEVWCCPLENVQARIVAAVLYQTRMLCEKLPRRRLEGNTSKETLSRSIILVVFAFNTKMMALLEIVFLSGPLPLSLSFWPLCENHCRSTHVVSCTFAPPFFLYLHTFYAIKLPPHMF